MKTTKSVIISVGNMYMCIHIYIYTHTQGKEEGWREGKRGKVGEREIHLLIYMLGLIDTCR